MVFTIRGLYHGNIWPNSRTICCQCPGLIMTHPSLFPHQDELIRSDKTKEAEMKGSYLFSKFQEKIRGFSKYVDCIFFIFQGLT